MKKVKIFSSPDIRIIEHQINEWLENNSWVKVFNITQSGTEKTTVISVWYEEPDVPLLG